MGETNGGRGQRLDSWKEIGSYLGVTSRTARNWEKSFELPVHRMWGGKKPRVYAYADEVDRWRQQREQLPVNGHRKVAASISAVLLLALFMSFGFWSGRDCLPVGIGVGESGVEARDDRGQPCWIVSPNVDLEHYSGKQQSGSTAGEVGVCGPGRRPGF